MSQKENNNEKRSGGMFPESNIPCDAFTSTYYKSIKTLLVLQSEEVEGIPESSGGSEVVAQTVSFVDNAEGEVIMAGSEINPIAKVDNTADLQLGQFLSRPTVIATYTWTTSDTIGVKSTLKP